MASATLLLPARARLDADSALPPALRRDLGRGDRRRLAAGPAAQLRRHFRLIPDHWPVAALTRQRDAADAAGACWLRADPAWIAPDMSGARLMAHGEALGLDAADASALLPALRPLFGDAGFPLDAPHPARWYLRLPLQTGLPAFADPDAALGEDLFEHLPQGDLGRRWRALANEAQVILHQHPWNARRAEQGRPPVNALWFWGGGALPDFVETPRRQLRSRDALLQSLAAAAGIGDQASAADAVTPGAEAGAEPLALLIDLRHLRHWGTLADEALSPLLAALRRGELSVLELDFEDGLVFSLRRRQRWRLWRGAWDPARETAAMDAGAT